MREVARGNDRVDHEESRLLAHGLAAAAQNGQALGITPVVKDPLEDIHLRAFGNGLKESPPTVVQRAFCAAFRRYLGCATTFG